jgi:hypothetical protein
MSSLLLASLCIGLATAGVLDRRQATSGSEASVTGALEQLFQTSPELWPGPTPTGKHAAFLAQTNPAPWGMSYVPPMPLETALPISGNSQNKSIFQLMGQLSHYFPSPGFGAEEYPLPPSANITHMHLLHRHGARYPTGDSSVATFGSKIQNITKNGTASWSGDLSFLSSWSYDLGAEILVPVGRQELYDSGVGNPRRLDHERVRKY